MKRILHVVFGAVILTVFVGSTTTAQSLGDAARQQRAEKTKTASKTFSNDDLSGLDANAISVVGEAPTADPAAKEDVKADAKTAEPANDKSKANDKLNGHMDDAKHETAIRYTVSWAAVPGVMNAAIFSFTVPAIASKDGAVPLSQVEIVRNPCSVSKPADPNPQLYATTTFHIYLGCPGLTKGSNTVGLARLVGDLPPGAAKTQGHYIFKGALGYYYYYTGRSFSDFSGTVEGRYKTTGTLDIVPTNTPP